MVKMTLLMPEDLWRRAKVRAMEERRDLKDLLLEGLDLVLKRVRGPSSPMGVLVKASTSRGAGRSKKAGEIAAVKLDAALKLGSAITSGHRSCTGPGAATGNPMLSATYSPAY